MKKKKNKQKTVCYVIMSDAAKTLLYATVNYIVMMIMISLLYILPVWVLKWLEVLDQCAKLSPFVIYGGEIIVLGLLGFCGYAIFLMIQYKIKKAKKRRKKKKKVVVRSA